MINWLLRQKDKDQEIKTPDFCLEGWNKVKRQADRLEVGLVRPDAFPGRSGQQVYEFSKLKLQEAVVPG